MITFLTVRRPRIGTLELDAAVSETHQQEVDVTEHPVERGSPVSDHLRPKPIQITIEGVISDTPLAGTEFAGLSSVASIITGAAPSRRNSRSESALAALQDLVDKQELITIVTGLRSYEDMAITSVTVPRSPSNGASLRFSIQARQVRQVSLQTVSVVPKAAPRKNKGSKATTKTPDPVLEKQSGLRALRNSKTAQALGDGVRGVADKVQALLSP